MLNYGQGKYLTLEGQRSDIRSEAAFILIFDTVEEAEEYAERKIAESPDIECHIIDHNGEQIKRVVKKGHTRAIHKPSYQWWKFWRWRF